MLKKIRQWKVNEKFFCKIFCALAIVVFGILVYHSLGITGENSGELTDEHIYFRHDSVILNLIGISLALTLLSLYGRLERFFHTKKRRNVLLAIVCALAVFIWRILDHCHKDLSVGRSGLHSVVCQTVPGGGLHGA